MAATGDWVTPRLNGIKYFEKPPLQYWATRRRLQALRRERVRRAPLRRRCAGLATHPRRRLHRVSRLAGIETGRRRRAGAGRRARTSWRWAASSRSTWGSRSGPRPRCARCLLAEARARRGRASAGAGCSLAWAAMALAVLSKGLVGIVFPAAALVLTASCDARLLHRCARLEWVRGLRALPRHRGALVRRRVAAPTPSSRDFFFVHEHFERFLTTAHRRVEPWWYFLPIIGAGLPAVDVRACPRRSAHAWRAEAGRAFQPLRVALAVERLRRASSSAPRARSCRPTSCRCSRRWRWCSARYLAEARRRSGSRCGSRWSCRSAIALAVASRGACRRPRRDAWTRALLRGRAAGCARRRPRSSSPRAIAAHAPAAARATAGPRSSPSRSARVLMIDCLEDAYEELSPRASRATRWPRRCRPLLKPGTRVYSVQHYDQTVPFYLGRTRDAGRLRRRVRDRARAPSPDATSPTLAAVRRANGSGPGEALAIMQPGTFEELQAQGLADARRSHEIRAASSSASRDPRSPSPRPHAGRAAQRRRAAAAQGRHQRAGRVRVHARQLVPVGAGASPPSPFIAGGLACYVVSVVVWIMGLSRVPVSIAYPMLSIGYVVNAVAALDAVRRSRSTAQSWSASASSCVGVCLVRAAR